MDHAREMSVFLAPKRFAASAQKAWCYVQAIVSSNNNSFRWTKKTFASSVAEWHSRWRLFHLSLALFQSCFPQLLHIFFPNTFAGNVCLNKTLSSMRIITKKEGEKETHFLKQIHQRFIKFTICSFAHRFASRLLSRAKGQFCSRRMG